MVQPRTQIHAAVSPRDDDRSRSRGTSCMYRTRYPRPLRYHSTQIRHHPHRSQQHPQQQQQTTSAIVNSWLPAKFAAQSGHDVTTSYTVFTLYYNDNCVSYYNGCDFNRQINRFVAKTRSIIIYL